MDEGIDHFLFHAEVNVDIIFLYHRC